MNHCLIDLLENIETQEIHRQFYETWNSQYTSKVARTIELVFVVFENFRKVRIWLNYGSTHLDVSVG